MGEVSGEAPKSSRSHGFSQLLGRRPRSRHAKGRTPSPDPEKSQKLIRRRVSSFQAVPPGPAQYDKDEDRFKCIEEVAVEDLEKILAGHDSDPHVKLKVVGCTWKTVFEQIVTAKNEHAKRLEVSDATAIATGVTLKYIDLIPEEYGLGVLKGALSLVFEAAKIRQENKERIVETLETIPETILTINTAYALLKPEAGDSDRLLEFFSMLVTDLPQLIKILVGKEPWYRKVVSTLALNIPEKLSIDDILGRWDSQMAIIKERVERMKIRILENFDASLAKVKKDVHDTREDVADVKTTTTSILEILAGSQSVQQAIHGALKRLEGNIPKRLTDIFRSQLLMSAAITGIYGEVRHLNEARARDHAEWLRKEERFAQKEENWDRERSSYQQDRRKLERDVSRLRGRLEEYQRQNTGSSSDREPSSMGISPIQLLGILDFPRLAAWDDFDDVLRQAAQFDMESQARARWLSATEEFRAWFTESRSSLLLVDGSADEQIQFVSPLSGFCCALISSLADSDDCIVLFFFAGLQQSRSEKANRGLNSPNGIIRSFIAQLLLEPKLAKPRLDFIDQEYLNGCTNHDTNALCDVLERLLRQVPPEFQVFCIVDGISWYEEQKSWLHDLRYLAATLEFAAQADRYQSCTLKVMMTCPGTSMEIVKRTTHPEVGRVWRHASLAAGHVLPEATAEII